MRSPGSGDDGVSYGHERRDSVSSIAGHVSDIQWLLTPDEVQNNITRSEFYYESAPSSSLCLSLLKLHSNKIRILELIIDSMVKPLFDAIGSNQVDYGLLISIIKSLLTSARVLAEESLESVYHNQDMDESWEDDNYSQEAKSLRTKLRDINLMISRSDIIKSLVESNYINKDVIHQVIFNESTSQSMVKLIEKLLEVERYELALNICRKHGMDVKGIWKNWALVCLKNGKFNEARVKFKHVMQSKSPESPPTSGRSPMQPQAVAAHNLSSGVANERRISSPSSGQYSYNSRILTDIFCVFDTQKHHLKSITASQVSNLKARVNLIKNGKMKQLHSREAAPPGDAAMSSMFPGMTLPSVLVDECLYYLKLYGSKEDHIRFHIKFGSIKGALELFLNDGVGSGFANVASNQQLINIFINDLLMDSLKKSYLNKLLQLIKSMDLNLVKSWKYLIASCRHLSNMNLYHTLHTLQVFMSDHVRASITQVNHFFLFKPYKDYATLHSRLDNLVIARDHLKNYLSNYLEKDSHLHPGSLQLSPEKVKKQIRIINLQIEITNCFKNRKVNGFLPFVFEPDVNSSLNNSMTGSVSMSSPQMVNYQSMTNSMSMSPNTRTSVTSPDHSLTRSVNMTRSMSVVSGGSSTSTSNTVPLTLLDESKGRRTQLAALVAVEAGSTIADGFSLIANKSFRQVFRRTLAEIN